MEPGNSPTDQRLPSAAGSTSPCPVNLQPRGPSLELGNADVKGRDRLIEAGCRRDRRERPSEPARHRRARDTDPRGEGGVTRVSDEAQESVVVASLGSFGRHRRIVQVIPCCALVRRGAPEGCVGNSNKNPGRS